MVHAPIHKVLLQPQSQRISIVVFGRHGQIVQRKHLRKMSQVMFRSLAFKIFYEVGHPGQRTTMIERLRRIRQDEQQVPVCF